MKSCSGNLKVENFPLDSIKGKICTQTYIEEFNDQRQNVDLSLKPKVIVYTLGIFILGLYIYCTIAAIKLGNFHPIKKYRRHLLSIKSHCFLASAYVM